MCKITIRSCIKFNNFFHTERTQEQWQNNSSNRVNTIYGNCKSCIFNCFYINKFQSEYQINMLLPPCIIRFKRSGKIVRYKIKIFTGSNFQYFHPFQGRQKLSIFIKQFQGIPFSRVMACSNNNSSIGICSCNREFNSWCGCHSQINHINSQATQSGNYEAVNHTS